MKTQFTTRITLSVLSLMLILSLTHCGPAREEARQQEENPAVIDMADENQPSPLQRLSGQIQGVKVDMQYGAPSQRGRVIWGDLVPYGQVWRTGANEASWVSFEKPVKINGNLLPAGKYSMFTIPGPAEWTVILNAEWEQWGAFDYDEAKDILRFKVTPEPAGATQERMRFKIEAQGIRFEWVDLTLFLKVEPA